MIGFQRALLLALVATFAAGAASCGGCPAITVATVVVRFAPDVTLPTRIVFETDLNPEIHSDLQCSEVAGSAAGRVWVCECFNIFGAREFRCPVRELADGCSLVFEYDGESVDVCLESDAVCASIEEVFTIERRNDPAPD